jgi:hypothetical protein
LGTGIISSYRESIARGKCHSIMSRARAVVEAYTNLLARAFNGAIDVDGVHIVAHPSGTLLARPRRLPSGTDAPLAWRAPVVATPANDTRDRENDWSDV